jgi:hypothetical protein
VVVARPPPTGPSDPETIATAISRACPFLHRVALPKGGWLSGPIQAPDRYPDIDPVRGYYVPVPAPAPFKVSDLSTPQFVGEAGGRQWSVHVVVSRRPRSPVAPTITVTSYVRFVPDDKVPFAVLPWLVATGQPGAGVPWSWAEGSENLAGYAARAAVGHASLHLGRPALATARPPVRTPMVLESWNPGASSFVTSAEFLTSYAQWQSRAGDGHGSSGTVYPVLEVNGDQLRFLTGVDLEQDPALHARTVRELIETASRLELEITHRDPHIEPIPTVTLSEPPGSVPDVRPAYRCPRCGKLEILQRVYERSTGLTHARTLQCGVDVFPPQTTRARDVFGAAERVIHP